MNCGKAKGQRKRTSDIFMCKNIVFMIAVQRKQCRNLSGMWSEAVQEACAATYGLGYWDLNLKGQSGSQPVIFLRFEKETLPSLQHCANITQLSSPHPLRAWEFPTQAGEQWGGESVICTGAGHQTPDLPITTSVPGRMSSSSSSYPKVMPRAISFCFRWVWWEILLFRQYSGFPASFHFFHWAEPWGCCTSSQSWTKRTWTTNCGSFLCALLISSTFTGSMKKCMYGPDPERCWAVQAQDACSAWGSASAVTLTWLLWADHGGSTRIQNTSHLPSLETCTSRS